MKDILELMAGKEKFLNLITIKYIGFGVQSKAKSLVQEKFLSLQDRCRSDTGAQSTLLNC